MQYMGKHNETVAIRSAGISIKRMSVPLFAFGFLVTILLFVFGDTVMPWAEDTRVYIERVKIKNQKKSDIRVRSNIQYKDDKNRLYYIGFLDGYKNKIKNIDISIFNNDNHIITKIQAEHGIWEADSTGSGKEMKLTFYNGYIREFDDNQLIFYTNFEEQYFDDIHVQPQDLVKSTKKPDEMTVFELHEYIERLRRIGEKHQRSCGIEPKLAYPFVNVIMILFCIPLATFSKRGKSRGIGFVIAIAICFYTFQWSDSVKVSVIMNCSHQ